MMPLLKKLIVLLYLLMLMPAHVVQADTGPKPTMEFEFDQDALAEPVKIIWGTLYECRESDCSDAAPLEDLGPQGFSCTVDRCEAMAYGFAPYHRIEIEFSDGEIRESNVFKTAGFNSRYRVTVRPDDLLVESQASLGLPLVTTAFVLLCACFLCGGVLVTVLIVFVIRRAARK